MTIKSAGPETGNRGESAPGTGRVVVLDQTLWERIADGDSLKSTLGAWLGIQCGMLDSVSQGVVVVRPVFLSAEYSGAAYIPYAVWPEGSEVSKTLAETTELTLSKGAGIFRAGEQTAGVTENLSLPTQSPASNKPSTLGFPLKVGGEIMGAISLQLDVYTSFSLKPAMRQLQLGAGWFEALLRREKAKSEQAREQHEKFALALIQNVLDEEDFSAACIGVVNELAVILKCERVSLGFRAREATKVYSLSHTVQVDSRLNLLNAIASAMDEAMDQDAVIAEPSLENSTLTLVQQSHRTLLSDHRSGAVISVPFTYRERKSGAFTFEKPVQEFFSEQELALCTLCAERLGPLLEERRIAQRWIGARLADYSSAYFSKLWGGGHLRLKVVTFVGALVLLLLPFLKGDYRVGADSYLKGEVQRIIAAPFDGYVADANYRAGDYVDEGAVIARMDDRELLLQHLNLQTTLRQYELEYDQALGTQNRAQAGVIRARISQAEAQLQLVTAQLERSRLIAPFSGILISGDLSQAIGGAIRKGDTLFEIVPSNLFRVVLKIDESDIKFLQQGQKGQLVLTAFPDGKFPFEVSTIGPVSTSDEGSNYFEVEARLVNLEELSGEQLATTALRPGMEGVARVTTQRRQLLWIWTHRFFDWVWLKYWALWP